MLDRKWIIIKDAVFAALGVWIISKGTFWAILIGAVALVWYGRDLYIQITALRAQKKAKDVKAEKPRQQTDGGKITISSDAKEVDYTKE
ncbi:MAG: hypothetical protein IKR38_05165 [Bacteroidales bacterium]|nr:hypothetical protein [Bacteroidales bacterium]